MDITESDQTFRRSLPNANIAIKLAKKIMAHSLRVGMGAFAERPRVSWRLIGLS